MAKRKKGSPSSSGGGSKGGFAPAFIATALVVVVVAFAWNAYGLDGYTPHISLTGWPMVVTLALLGACGVAYWRGGKPALWGVVAATCGAVLVIAWLTDSLPRP